MSVTIYTSKNCHYCEMAKDLLNRKKIKYKTIDITENQNKKLEMVKKSNGLKTVPQIFINGKHIGGYEDLVNLDILDKLGK